MPEIERRFIDVKELRVSKKDDQLIIEGYPIKYNTRTVLWPGVAEEIRPGASTAALKLRNTNVYWNHNPGMPMAGFNNGTLEAAEEEAGVHMVADVAKTIWGRNGHEAIDAGQVHQMSFAFNVEEEEWIREEHDDGSYLDIRIIHKFREILDFSPVSEPAYPSTEVYARSKEYICRNMPKPETSDEAAPTGEESHETPISILREKLNLKTNRRFGC